MKKFKFSLVIAALAVLMTIPSFAASYSGLVPNPDASVYDCQYIMDVAHGAAIDFNFFKGFYDDVDHYLVCPDCGAYGSFGSLNGDPAPHVDGYCTLCSAYSDLGLEILGPFPKFDSNIFSSISAIVTAAVAWLSAFVLCIVSNPLLLVFVVCVFVGLGIGLVKRIIRL